MKNIKRKEVVWPIRVPVGDYCWDYDKDGSCDYFDNEGGHPDCELKFWDQKSTSKGVLKDPKCAALQDVLIAKSDEELEEEKDLYGYED